MVDIQLGGLMRTGMGRRADGVATGAFRVPEWRGGKVDWPGLPAGYVYRLYVWCNCELGTGESVTPQLRRADGAVLWTGAPQTAQLTDDQISAGTGRQTWTLVPESGTVWYELWGLIAGTLSADVFAWGELRGEPL